LIHIKDTKLIQPKAVRDYLININKTDGSSLWGCCPFKNECTDL